MITHKRSVSLLLKYSLKQSSYTKVNSYIDT